MLAWEAPFLLDNATGHEQEARKRGMRMDRRIAGDVKQRSNP